MALVPKQLGQVAPTTTTWTDLYTVPSGRVAVVQALEICNSNAVDVTVRLCFVASGGSAGVSNAILWNITIEASSTLAWRGPHTLKDVGSKIRVYSSNNDVCFTASGLERT